MLAVAHSEHTSHGWEGPETVLMGVDRYLATAVMGILLECGSATERGRTAGRTVTAAPTRL